MNKKMRDAIKGHYLEKVAGLTQEIEVPEWGITVYVKPITLAERARLHQLASIEDEFEQALALIREGCKDKNGKQLFEEEDIQMMRDLPSDKEIGFLAEQVAKIIFPNMDEVAKN